MTILKRLHTSGHQGYVVGGAVRDYCLGRKIMDWDVATSAGFEEIKSLFTDVRYFSLKHGTVTLIAPDFQCEVTTFKTGKGFEQTIEKDLDHRDFTINAMAYDIATKAIVDPHGGRKHLSRRL